MIANSLNCLMSPGWLALIAEGDYKRNNTLLVLFLLQVTFSTTSQLYNTRKCHFNTFWWCRRARQWPRGEIPVNRYYSSGCNDIPWANVLHATHKSNLHSSYKTDSSVALLWRILGLNTFYFITHWKRIEQGKCEQCSFQILPKLLLFYVILNIQTISG